MIRDEPWSALARTLLALHTEEDPKRLANLVETEGCRLTGAERARLVWAHEVPSGVRGEGTAPVVIPLIGMDGEQVARLELWGGGLPASAPDVTGDPVTAFIRHAAVALERARRISGQQQALERVSRLLEVGKAITAEIDLDRLLTLIVERTTALLNADRSSLFLVDRKRDELWSKVAQGLEVQEIRFPLGQGLAGKVAVTGEMVNIADAYADPRFNQAVDRQTGYRTRSVLCLPVRNTRGEILGVFQVLNRQHGPFTAPDVEILEALASHAAIALENARLYEDVRRALERLEGLDRLKSNFLAIISHELRTPIAPIVGYLEMLEGGLLGSVSEGQKRAYEVMTESIGRLRGLVEDLLAFVQVDQGELSLEITPVDLAALVMEVGRRFAPKAEESRLSLTLEVPDGLPRVRGDRQALERICTHLIDNAIKFTPEGGRVTVGLSAEGESVELAVADTGIGIPEEEQARIFDRFYQVEGALTRRHGGVGMGLAVIKQLAEAHGSKVDVTSRLGEGSTFRLRLAADH